MTETARDLLQLANEIQAIEVFETQIETLSQLLDEWASRLRVIADTVEEAATDA